MIPTTNTDDVLAENKGPIKVFADKADLPAITVALLEELAPKKDALVNESDRLVAYGEMCGIVRAFKRLREISRHVEQKPGKRETKDPDMES